LIGRLLSAAVQLPLHLLDPEAAHGLAIAALKSGLFPHQTGSDDPALKVELFGLSFANPVGLAAGFDKNAEVFGATLKLGFGFVEIGTVTPRPQPGNAKPRVFRLSEDKAVINRLGFNNDGHEAAYRRLAAARPGPGIVGVNIGANKDTTDRIADYVAGIGRFAALADYVTVNISSPNTPGLRGLQDKDRLDDLLARVMAERAAHDAATPILIKIAPGLDQAAIDDIAGLCQAHDIAGLIVSNTTISRDNLRSPAAAEVGGLSGAPLFDPSTAALAKVYLATGGRLPLIGVGGIDAADKAWTKFEAGASLIQLYTGMIYHGPGVIGDIKRGLGQRLRREGIGSITDITGRRAPELAKL
jgi:dihydroorotate dehydrogenase